jgi:hypothetical protein
MSVLVMQALMLLLTLCVLLNLPFVERALKVSSSSLLRRNPLPVNKQHTVKIRDKLRMLKFHVASASSVADHATSLHRVGPSASLLQGHQKMTAALPELFGIF